MKGKAGGGRKGGGCGGPGGTAPADLLVCFPPRQHLALMPKPICSPSRTAIDKAARRHLPARRPASGGGSNRGRTASPLFNGCKAKNAESDVVDEPQSPKVTCAGQIKVRARPRPRPAKPRDGEQCGKSWISMVEEFERLHEQRKKVSWLEAIGLKKDALPFLGGALRSLRLKARCFGSFHGAVDSSTDEEDNDGADEEEKEEASVFSKWLMVLEESQGHQEQEFGADQEEQAKDNDECSRPPSMPPPNALLLMRCRSAPVKALPTRDGGEHPGESEEQDKSTDVHTENNGEEEENKLVFMRTAPDFLKLSMDIAKETWLVGGGDPLARSRSWKK